jgi:hypothetical protein
VLKGYSKAIGGVEAVPVGLCVGGSVDEGLALLGLGARLGGSVGASVVAPATRPPTSTPRGSSGCVPMEVRIHPCKYV